MAKSFFVLFTSLILAALVLPAQAGGVATSAKFRFKGNKCAKVGLSLSETKAFLLAGKKRVKVGFVSLSTSHGKLVTKIKTIHGCSLSEVRVDIFPGHSLGHASPIFFPCRKKIRHSSSGIVKCPIKKFPRIRDCCAEHFVIVVYAIVKCKRVPYLRSTESAYAAGKPCTKKHFFPCSYVPVKLIPKCVGKGCIHNTPFVVVCKKNKCIKIPQKPCDGKKCDHNTPVLNKCVDGECKYFPQPPCLGRTCDHNTPVLNKCVDGICKDFPDEPCTGPSCDGITPVFNKCVKGYCEDIKFPPCIGKKCDGDTPLVNTCVEGKCKYEEQEPCEGKKCVHNTPVVNTCIEGKCVYKEQEPCLGKTCRDNTPLLSICVDGHCLEKLGKTCKNSCFRKGLKIIRVCKLGRCKPLLSKCGRCEICKYDSHGNAICVKKICPKHYVLNRWCRCVFPHHH